MVTVIVLFLIGLFVGNEIQEYRLWKLRKEEEQLNHDLELINMTLDTVEKYLRESLEQEEQLDKLISDSDKFLKEHGIEVDYSDIDDIE